MKQAVQTVGLRKTYRVEQGPRRARGAAAQGVVALDGLDLEVREGEFFGLLGPNGAGKTTAVGVLTTRIRPTGGTARVAGADVASQPIEVRARIGVVPQRPNPDRGLSVLENLVFHARYFGVPGDRAAQRAEALLERFSLTEKAAARIDGLSGGQLQRLMIARAMMHDPEILFLDEPSTGLDPQSRLELWDALKRIQSHGRTIVMTTHYMEEAERLCDRIAVIDRGRLLVADTPDRLKAQAPGETVIDVVIDGAASSLCERVASIAGVTRTEPRDGTLRVYSARGGEIVGELVRAAEAGGCAVEDLHITRPSLETLFIALTGRKFGES